MVAYYCLFLPWQSQEKEARDEMKRRSKELQLAKREARKEGRSHYSGGFGGGGGGYNSHDGRGAMSMGPTVESLPPAESRSSYNAAGPRSVKEVLNVVSVYLLLFI